MAPAEIPSVTVEHGQESKVTLAGSFNAKYLVAPVRKGQQVGTLVLMVDGKPQSTIPMLTTAAVGPGGLVQADAIDCGCGCRNRACRESARERRWRCGASLSRRKTAPCPRVERGLSVDSRVDVAAEEKWQPEVEEVAAERPGHVVEILLPVAASDSVLAT